MIVNCTACGELLGSVFIFVDRHTRLCLDCGEKRTKHREETEPHEP